jgi:rubrerythrin/ferredoxin
MANVTFSSPVMAKDITVYAVAGDRGTILSLAKAHKIPIPFDCQDGECGSCIVDIKHFSPLTKHGIALTEKEKEALRQLGKISSEEIRNAEVNDMPPRHRLACQCFVRNEDILVTFEGDETLPARGPHLSTAAKIYKGGIKINTLDQFFAFALRVEDEAATHFSELGAAMEHCGNTEVAKLFNQLAGYSRLHFDQTRARAGSREVSDFLPPDYVWPDQVTPERTELWASDPDLSRLDALKAALQGERRGYEFYYAVAGTSNNPEVSATAKEFVKEEAEHVKILEAWITREEWQQKAHEVAG